MSCLNADGRSLLSDTGMHTIAAMVMGKLRCLPKRGESVIIGDCVATGEQVSSRDIDRVKIEPASQHAIL